MPSFTLPSLTLKIKKCSVKRTAIPLVVRFRLPPEIKEQIPATEAVEIEGDRLMNFYAKPTKGDLLECSGYEWEVTHLKHYPTARYSSENKTISLVRTTFVGRPDYTDDFEPEQHT